VRPRRSRHILTPEHVEISLEPAGLGSRFIATVVDFALASGVAVLIAQVSSLVTPLGIGAVVRAVSLLVVNWGYHVYFETRHQGQSPGKRVVGLRVVDGRGLPLSVEQSFVRNVLRAVDVVPIGYAVGGACCMLDREHRRLGDMAADTLVVREQTLGEWDRRASRERTFNSLRTPRVLRLIRHRVGLEEREYLSILCARAEALEATARFDLMETVGRHYREVLGVDDPRLSGENLVRGLTGILFSDRVRSRGPALGRRG
jgi:uncharacterized RDD family membrane protein YckC